MLDMAKISLLLLERQGLFTILETQLRNILIKNWPWNWFVMIHVQNKMWWPSSRSLLDISPVAANPLKMSCSTNESVTLLQLKVYSGLPRDLASSDTVDCLPIPWNKNTQVKQQFNFMIYQKSNVEAIQWISILYNRGQSEEHCITQHTSRE